MTETENDWLVTFYRTGTYSATVSGYAGNMLKEVPLTIQVVAAAEDIQRFTLKLPAGLQAIDDETFAGAAMNVADLRETGITSIGSYAFRNCRELTDVYLPAGVNSIADNAFEGCLNIVFHCPKGSYAETYAAAHGIRTVN